MTVMLDIQETLEDHARRGVFVHEVRISDDRFRALVSELFEEYSVPPHISNGPHLRVVGPFGFCRVASVLAEWDR